MPKDRLDHRVPTQGTYPYLLESSWHPEADPSHDVSLQIPDIKPPWFPQGSDIDPQTMDITPRRNTTKRLVRPRERRLAGAATYKTTFNPEWTKQHNFIQQGSTIHHFFCRACNVENKCSHQGYGDVKRHLKSDSHINKSLADNSTFEMKTYENLADQSSLMAPSLVTESLPNNPSLGSSSATEKKPRDTTGVVHLPSQVQCSSAPGAEEHQVQERHGC